MGQVSSNEQRTSGCKAHHKSAGKGLQNARGENNCFLNVIVQSLWHLESFRVLLSTVVHVHAEHTFCIICALQELFTHYKYGEDQILNPGMIRITMDWLGRHEDRFQLGDMHDAAEALDAIFQAIHNEHIIYQSKQTDKEGDIDDQCNPRCIIHTLFACDMFDLYKCKFCGSTSDPEFIFDTMYRIYVSEVALIESKAKLDWTTVFKHIISNGPGRSCPGFSDETPCEGKTNTDRWILRLPFIFGVNLVWDSEQASSSHAKMILSLIASQPFQKIDLRDLFHLGGDTANADIRDTMVCYYGKHYVCFFFNILSAEWYLFDDQTIRSIGRFSALSDHIVRGAYQPTLLFWEKE